MTDKTQALRDLLVKAYIPEFQCKSGCHDCCGLVPFSDSEKRAVEQIRPLEVWEPFISGSWVLKSALASLTCPFIVAKGCGIYENRPMVCRLFGAVDHQMMQCPHGCGPAEKISDVASRALIAQAEQ